MLQAAVEKLSRRACCPCELLQTHATQVLAVDVKLLKRDAAGVQLVGVQEVLQPLPHLILGPVLGMDFMPLASEEPAGNCKTGSSTVSGLWLLLGSLTFGMPCGLLDAMGTQPQIMSISMAVGTAK